MLKKGRRKRHITSGENFSDLQTVDNGLWGGETRKGGMKDSAGPARTSSRVVSICE